MIAGDQYEKKLWENGNKRIAAVDETGYGSLISDVYVAAVIFPPNFDYRTLLSGINDSKKLSQENRERLCPLIKNHALSWAIGTASIEEILEYNIYWARFIAARRALNDLNIKPDYILMDGNSEIPDVDIPQSALIKGDARSFSIASASVIAKVERDQYIINLSSKVHEDYGWASNKGYYTKKHVNAIQKYGKTKWHRHKFVQKFLESEK